MVEGTFIPIGGKIPTQFVKDFQTKIEEASIKVIFLEDIHEYGYVGGIKALATYINQMNFNGVIYRYEDCPETNLLKEILAKLGWNGKFHWTPHSIPSEFSFLSKHEKNYDILLFGTICPFSYPLRHKLYNILSGMKDLNIKFILKDGSNIQRNGDIFGPTLIEELSKYYLVVATRLKYDNLVRKYFEISAAGSVVLGNMATDGKEIWEDNYIHVDENMPDEEIERIIREVLMNKEDLENKAKIMKDKIFLQHITAIRITHLLNFIKELE